MARILVTGGAGFIGSNLVRRLVGDGHQVLNVDALTYAGNPNSLTDVAHRKNYHFLQADITHADAVRMAINDFRPTGIIHLAAESHVDRSIDSPGKCIQTNVIGTFHLLQSALDYYRSLPGEARETFRFLHISTDEVFGSLGDEGYFAETTPYNPSSPYSASKASADHLVRTWYRTFGLPVLVTNCSNNYGPYQFPEKLIPVVILKCLRGEPIPVYGNGENIRDWLYVEDHCSALYTVLARGRVGETYNIGGNNEKKNIELVYYLCSLMDELSPCTTERNRSTTTTHSRLITFVEDRPGHDLRYAMDTTKIRQELGWVPEHNHESGFRKTVHWYINHRAWWEEILSGTYRLERLGGQKG